MKKVSLFWFRRDLRLHDNRGLYECLRKEENVLPIFIFDTSILNKLENKKDPRVEFIHLQLSLLKKELESFGSSLLVLHGKPEELVNSLMDRYQVKSIYCNEDYETYSRNRDENVRVWANSKGVEFHSFKEDVIFHKNEVVKSDCTPYSVFTPYSRKWKEKLSAVDLKEYDISATKKNFILTKPFGSIALSQIGFQKSGFSFSIPDMDEEIIKAYDKNRDIPSADGTTKLGLHLRFGTISIRQVVKKAMELNPVFLNQLIWRDFFKMILWHFPKVENGPFQAKFNRLIWPNNEDYFKAWCEGKTGYPMVDAGMRELNATGYMHNRVRMITANFLSKLLLIDWRWGEAYFAEKLLDFDQSSNNGSWQWAAGTGCDAMPYNRIFNPQLQIEKFDSDFKYIRKWIPEFDSFNYPKPIVDYKEARNKALEFYSVLKVRG